MRKRKIVYCGNYGGSVFPYIVDLANELVNNCDIYIAYVVRKQPLIGYKDYFDKKYR